VCTAARNRSIVIDLTDLLRQIGACLLEQSVGTLSSGRARPSRDSCRQAGLVAFEVNPHHRRAQLVTLTEKGRRTFEAAMELQAPWVNGVSDGLSVKEIETVHRVVTALQKNWGERMNLTSAASR
jgi:hypothetical protein